MGLGQPIIIDDRIILSGFILLNQKNEIILLKRKDHKHLETPGGKVENLDCKDEKNPTIKDFEKTAIRELFEELGQEFIIEETTYLDSINFTTPNNKKATAHKFLSKVVWGEPKILEPETFSEIMTIPFSELSINKDISDDLKIFIQEKDLIKKIKDSLKI